MLRYAWLKSRELVRIRAGACCFGIRAPTIFNSADVAVITKSDLAVAVEFDEAFARRNIQAARPGMEIFKLSAKTGEGMAEYLEFLESRRMRSRAVAAV